MGAFVARLAASPDVDEPSSRQVVREVLGRDASEVVADPAFVADEALVSDALAVAAIATPRSPSGRGRLVRARRAFALVRRLAEVPPGKLGRHGVRRSLTATLLLPGAVFPIPDGNGPAIEAERSTYRKRIDALAKEAERAQTILTEIERTKGAALELTRALTDHLALSRHEKAGGALGHEPAVLPAARFSKLTEQTRRVVLGDLQLPVDAVDVTVAVAALERRLLALAQTLATGFDDRVVDHVRAQFPARCGACESIEVQEPKAENDFDPSTRGRVELAGTQDLLLVRQELLGYRKGEIAHVENALRGERKARKHRKLHRTEVSVTEEREREEEVEDDLQTTDKYELQTETARVISEDKAVEAGVTVTASYGPVDVEAHGSFAVRTSAEESRSAASTFARDVISRSLRRIRERVLTRRSRTDIAEVEIINDHELDNTSAQEHVTGVYRWLDKRYRVQIMNYGRRAMLEFMVPEPAAFHVFALTRTAAAMATAPTPPGFCRDGVFQPLRPGDLGPDNYGCFVARYNVKNVTPPPVRYTRVCDVLKHKIDSTSGAPVVFVESNDSFKVPAGYRPIAVSYNIAGGNSHSGTTSGVRHDDLILALVTVADRKVFRYYKNEIGRAQGEESWPDLEQVIEWGNPLSPRELAFKSYSIGGLAGSLAVDGTSDTIKISVAGHSTLPMSVAVHYSVLCERTPARYEQWQLDTFNAIHEAYAAARQEHEAARDNQGVADILAVRGQNPERNRSIERRELKKYAISILTGQQFDAFDAMGADHRLHVPQIDLVDAAAEGAFVRFFEQALEWRHMTYLFYPYFWGRKPRWAEAVERRDEDPRFEQFLQAGYARVWVPIRPGFETVVASYIQCGGEPWTERDAPLCDEPGGDLPIVSLIEEMTEQLGADFEPRAGTLTVRAGDARVDGVGTDFIASDVDREILIDLERYRIVAVDEVAQQVRLQDPYRGIDRDGIGYAIGARLVGEPWVVEVPTNLVYLEADPPLIDG